MSHPLYNPYASGKRNSTQGQYGQTERDTQRPSSFLGHGSVFSSSGAPLAVPGNSGGRDMTRDMDAKSSMDIHISKGRKPMDSAPFTSAQRNEFRSSGAGIAAYPVTSASSSRYTNKAAIESGGNNLNWLTSCPGPSPGGSSSTLSNLAGGNGGRVDTSSKVQHDLRAIPGLGDYDSPGSGRSHPFTEPGQPKYTSESAVSILQRFGLEKEDLEHLISYPENQITPANLPFILREIRLQKDKKAVTGVQSNLYGEHRPTGAVGGMDSYGLSRGTDVHIQETSTSVLQPSKVIDYGHTGKYTAGIGDEIGRKSDRDNSGGSKTVFMTGTAANRQNLEPLQKKITDSKSSALGSSHEQKSPFTSLSSPYRPAPSSVASTSGDQTKQMTKQAFQNILSSFQLPKKDTATRGLMSEASKPETQASSTSSHGMHSSGHSLALIGDSDPSRTEDELSKTRNKMSVVIEHIMKHRGKQKEQMQQQMRTTKPVQKQPAQQQQSKGQAKQSKKKLPSKTRKGLPPDFGGSVPPSKKKPPTSKKLPKDKVDKDQPTPEMLYDYAAAPPRIFPHTCTLCYKDCANMQDWITHQNSSHHLESCTRLKKHYPKWDGEIVFGPRPVGKEAKPSTSTSAKKTKRTRSHSQSKSLSPKRRRGLEGKRRSRSPSPQSSKYSRRYDSPASPCYSSRSRSSERRLSPWRAADIRSPFRRSNDSRSPTRRVVVNRRSPPRRKSNETWSRDDGSRSPQRRGSQRWSPPRGFDERRSPQRRADDRHSPPRRAIARWSPSRRSDHSRSPQARSQERRSSREGSSPPKMGLNSAESLAKKLLETSAVQSLSNQSDLAAVVKTLAPALLAELAKMTSSSSTPSSSAAKRKLSKTVSSKVKSSSRTVELKNIDARLPDNDLSSLLGQFGKTKSIKINRSTKRAIVQYERLEAAENLRYAGSFTIKGIQVVVARGKIAATKSTQRKSSKSSASAPQTARLARTTTSTKKPLLPTPNCPPPTPQPSGVIRKTTSKILSQKTAAKVLVSKAKNVSTKKVRKIRTLREMPLKGAAKTDPVTQNTTSGLEDMSQQGDPGSEQKPTPEKSDSTSAADTVKVTEILRGPPMEEKILSSETETVQTVQEPEAAEEVVTPTPSISAASENQARVGDSEDKPDKSGVRQSGTADAEKDTSNTATEAGKEPSTETETSPTTQKPKEEPKPPGSGPEPSETLKETPQKSANVGKESRAESLKLSQSESKAPGSPEVQADTAESGKAPPPTVVKLHGICSSLSHSDILSAVENFGKTKSVVVFRARLEAIVIFEKAEGAQKLRSVKSLNVNGVPVAVVGEKESVCKERKTPPVRQSTSESTPPPSLTTPKRITPTEEKAFTPEVKKTVKTETLAVEGLRKEQVIPTESKSSESLPVSGDSKQTLTPEKSKIATEESVVQLRDKDETTEQVKGVKIKTETVSASRGESVTGENIGGTTAKDASEPTRTTSAPNNQPDVGKSEAVGQGENKNLIKAEDASEPMELKVQGITAEKPEDKERDKSAEDKPSQSPPPTGSDETQVTETSDKDGAASTAHGPETKTETAEGQQQEGGGTNEAAVEEAVPGGGAKTITTGKGPSAAVTTQIPSPSTEEVSKAKAGSQASAVSPETPSSSAKPAAAAASGQKPTTSGQPSAAVVCPTIGEMLKTTLDPQNIFCWSPPEVLPQRYPQYHRSVFISGLPLYHDGFYTEEDIVNLLVPFGFRSQDNKIFVIPQTGMAFATMPSRDTVMHLMTVSVTNGIYFRGIRLLIEVMHSQVQMLPLKFYMFMKRLLMCSVHDEGKRTVMIRNISQPDIRKLREALTEFAPITNFLPLLNKVFVEFKSVEDAGRFEKWYNQACPPPLSNVWRKRQVIMLAPAGPVTVKKAPQKAQSVPPVPKGKKVLVYKSGEIVFPQKPKAEGRKLVGSKAESNEKIEETAGEDPSVPSTSTESGEPNKSEGAGEPMEHEEQGVEGKAEALKSDETASSGAVPESSSDKPKEKQDPGAEAKPAPKGTATTTTTKDASKTASGGSAVSVEAPSSSSKPAAAASKQKKDSSSSSAVRPPTPGEMLEKRLFAHKIYCHALSTLSPLGNDRQLLLTGLPKFHDGLYTEDDVADLLVPFGFQDKEDKLFVVPQSRMAYAVMPSMKNVLKVLRESERNGIFLKEKKLSVRVVSLHYPMKALQFYTFVKRLLKCSVNREAERTVLIRNISQTEMKELREALQEYAPFNNFMPLLNKLYIEFNTYGDALRFKDWYSRRSNTPGHEVNMLKKSGPAAADKEPVQDKDRYFGETIENVLTKKQIDTVKSETANTPKMLITWLFEDCCCAEDDITELLTPFGYQHKDHNIYIFPQGCLAFVQMPTSRHVFDVLRASKREPIKLNGCELTFHAVNDEISLRPFWFYKFMMDLGNYPVTEDRDSIIFIRNISPAEIQELRDVLKKLNSVRNFWPLLNKVFIEFQTPCDADWLGVWYSLLKNPPNHRIQRLKIPHSGHSSSPAPKLPEDSQLDCKDLIEGATLPSVKTGVPQGSASPFWISLRNNPFVFPSISPWFIIPEYLTVKRLNDIERASRRGSMCPTVMLTGLPEGEYKHEDVARLVWPFFPKQDLRSLYYNVTVLPLQRRAFVFFADWMTCFDFVKAHITKRTSLKKRAISVHLVLQNMHPEFSEEAMYTNLMKLSNARVPDPASLEERLLCVEVSEVSLDVITLVVEMVASITSFVNFLPLANRICIEMADSASVAQVVERYNDLTPSSFTEDPAWSKVQNFETLESLRQRLQEAGEDTIDLEPEAVSEVNEPPETDKSKLKTITVTVGPHRLVRKSRSLSPERRGDANFTEDYTPADFFDGLQFNEDEFVTVDEVYDDVGEGSSERRRPSSSTHSSRDRRDSRASSGGGRTSSRSSKDHRSSASSSSRSARTTRSANSSSERNASKPSRSSTKPSSSASASKSASPSPFVSLETLSSPDQRAKPSETDPPGPSSSSAPSETQPEQRAVPLSDHTASAEGPAAETVESETKMEARGEMHPPHQGPGFDLNQIQDMGIDLDRTNEDQKEDEEETDEIKHDDLQTLTPAGDQSAEQMTDGGQEGRSESQPGDLVLEGVKAETEESGEMDPDGPSQVLDEVSELCEEDDGSKTDQAEDKNGLETNAEEVDTGSEMFSPESSTETPQGQTSTEDQPLQEEDLKDPEGPEQTFEILDSIDDQTETEDDPAKLETLSSQTSKDDQPVEDEGDAYQVIDSVEDQPMSRQQRPRRGARRDDRSSRRSGSTNRTSKSDETEKSPKKQDKTDIRTKTEVSEDVVFEIVDSVEEEPAEDPTRESPGRRRSTRRKKEAPAEEAEKPEEVTYEILDSVETTTDEPTITTRSTRGRRGRPSKEAMTEKMQREETPTSRRQTRSREKTPKTDETLPPKESVGEGNEEITTYKILDSVEDGPEEDQPAPRGRGMKGRPKKPLKTTKKDDTGPNEVDQETSEKVGNEDEATYQILDSVEDDLADDRPIAEQPESERKEEIIQNTEEGEPRGAGSTKSEEEEEEQEEPLFQVVDSLEEEQTVTEASEKEGKDNTETGEDAVKEDPQSGFSTVSEGSEKPEESLAQGIRDPEEVSAGAGKEDRKETPRIDHKEEDSPSPSSSSVRAAADEEQMKSTLVNLDTVSDEEEDYSDDAAEEEELRKRQTAAKEKLQRARRSGVREEREQQRRRGGGGSRRGRKRGRVDVDSEELVTLDEVGSDDVEDEKKRRERGEESAGGEGRALVTLDEFVEEEKTGQGDQKPQTLSQDEGSGEDLNHETLVTLDEAVCDEDDNKPDLERTRRTPGSAKRNHDDDPVESVNFVIVDEVKDEENRETPKTRGRGKKRSRQTPVRKSTRGNTKSTIEEPEEEEKELTEVSSARDKHPLEVSNDDRQEAQETAENPSAAEPELQPESETLKGGEEEREGWRREEVKVGSKHRREPIGPESKRSRSQSPSVPHDFKLPDFKPNNPLGKEFVVPGYFCNLCSVFYPSETTAKELHCSSQTHYNNLKKHFQKLQQKSGSSARSCPGSLSD